MDKLKLLLGSRKFWAAVVGLVLMSVKAWYPNFPLEEEPLTGIITLLVAYILGTGIEDGLSRKSDSRQSSVVSRSQTEDGRSETGKIG